MLRFMFSSLGRHLNYPPVRMGMSRPKQLIPGNKEYIHFSDEFSDNKHPHYLTSSIHLSQTLICNRDLGTSCYIK